MSHIKYINGYYFRYEGNKIKESYGKYPPIVYKPKIIEGDARKKIGHL